MRVTTERVTTEDGIEIAVHEWGRDPHDAARTPVLLAHPTGFHGRIWEPTAQQLVAAGYRVVSLDFRGHGDSDPDPAGEYPWRSFALDARAVAAWIDDERLVAAGHSKGGAALLLGAADAPGTYAGIWAYEPIVFPSDELIPPNPDFALAVGARRRRNEWRDPDEAFIAYSRKPPLDVMDVRCVRAYVDHGLRDRGDGVHELKCAPHVEAAVYTMGPNNGVFPRLHEITIPVRLLCGATSRDMSPAFIDRLAARLPDATVDVWDGHGHFGPQADPERAAASIVEFARGLR